MKNVLIFLAGAGIGAGATWYFVKKHYEKIADEEINDVVTRFKAYRDQLEETHKEVEEVKEDADGEDDLFDLIDSLYAGKGE